MSQAAHIGGYRVSRDRRAVAACYDAPVLADPERGWPLAVRPAGHVGAVCWSSWAAGLRLAARSQASGREVPVRFAEPFLLAGLVGPGRDYRGARWPAGLVSWAWQLCC
jgi:hypothetical protein